MNYVVHLMLVYSGPVESILNEVICLNIEQNWSLLRRQHNLSYAGVCPWSVTWQQKNMEMRLR